MARHSEENSQGEHECTRRQLADPKYPNLLQTNPMSIYLRILHFQVQDRNRELAIPVQQQQQQQQLKPTEPSLTCRLCVLHTFSVFSTVELGTTIHHFPQVSENGSPEKLHSLPQINSPDTQTPLCLTPKLSFSKATIHRGAEHATHSAAAGTERTLRNCTCLVSSVWTQDKKLPVSFWGAPRPPDYEVHSAV